jgi:phosphoribosylformimino-5-aminoimidazole carboxamide ribotide isomerase
VQLGGGIRTLADVERWIEAGVSRVILGTVAVKQPDIVIAARLAYPEQIAVSVDVRKGKVAVDGWTADSDLDAITVAKRFEDAGVAALIITDIDRDGTVMGFNVDAFGASPMRCDPGDRRRRPGHRRRHRRLKARKGVPIAGPSWAARSTTAHRPGRSPGVAA